MSLRFSRWIVAAVAGATLMGAAPAIPVISVHDGQGNAQSSQSRARQEAVSDDDVPAFIDQNQPGTAMTAGRGFSGAAHIRLAAERRQNVARGVSPWKIAQQNESPGRGDIARVAVLSLRLRHAVDSIPHGHCPPPRLSGSDCPTPISDGRGSATVVSQHKSSDSASARSSMSPLRGLTIFSAQSRGLRPRLHYAAPAGAGAGASPFAINFLDQLLLQTPLTSGGRFGDKDQIGREFENLRDQPEFRRLRKAKPQPASESEWPEWIRNFFRWLRDLFSSAGNAASGLGVLFQVLAYGILAAVAAVIVWLVVRVVQNYQARQSLRLKGRRGHEEGEADIPPGDLPADEYLRRAAELAERGLYREAIGQLILGAMSRTERSGLIRFRRGLTHRDYLRALRSRAMPHQAFKTIVSVYEPICFGRRPAQIDHYLTSLDGYKTGFRDPLAEGNAPVKSPLTGQQPAGAPSTKSL